MNPSPYADQRLGTAGTLFVLALAIVIVTLGLPLLKTAALAIAGLSLLYAAGYTWGSSTTAGMLVQTERYGEADAANA